MSTKIKKYTSKNFNYDGTYTVNTYHYIVDSNNCVVSNIFGGGNNKLPMSGYYQISTDVGIERLDYLGMSATDDDGNTIPFTSWINFDDED